MFSSLPPATMRDRAARSRTTSTFSGVRVTRLTSMAAHKMITRHEHVFGKAKAENAQAVVSVWENA